VCCYKLCMIMDSLSPERLHKIWNSRANSVGTKLRLFNSDLKSVLLYGCETWKASKTITKKLQVLINKCLRRILRTLWPVQMSNNDLWTSIQKSELIYKFGVGSGIAGPYTS
jgi:hypothetical protein